MIYRKKILPGLLLSLVFLGIGLLINKDFGLAVDESNVMAAGQYNVRALPALLLQGEIPSWSPHDLPGYYFVVDTIRAYVAKVVLSFNPSIGFIHAFNIGNLVFSSAAILVLYLLAYCLTESLTLSLAAAVAMAISPQYIAHSQNNAVDLVSLFVFSLSIYDSLS